VLAEVDAFLATLAVSDEERAAAPETFDARNYLVRHQDVLHARMSPWLHYDRYGREEGRSW